MRVIYCTGFLLKTIKCRCFSKHISPARSMSGIPKKSISTKSKPSIPGRNGRVCCFILDHCFVFMGTANDVLAGQYVSAAVFPKSAAGWRGFLFFHYSLFYVSGFVISINGGLSRAGDQPEKVFEKQLTVLAQGVCQKAQYRVLPSLPGSRRQNDRDFPEERPIVVGKGTLCTDALMVIAQGFEAGYTV